MHFTLPPFSTVRIFSGLLVASFLFAGCQTASNLAPINTQTVSVTTFPAGAEVFVEGTYKGLTPLVLDLDKSYSQEVIVRREFFAVQAGRFNPSFLTDDRPFFRFGWIDYDAERTFLRPENLHFNLQTNLIPLTAEGGYGGLQGHLDRADALLADGRISDEDHRVITLQLTEFFSARGR